MGTGRLTIDLDAVVANWRALDNMTSCKTAAVVKANGYGIGAANVAKALFKAGVRQFFVAVAEEAEALRAELGQKPEISVFSGHMKGDTDLIRELNLTPMLNSVDQLTHHLEALPGHPFGIQLDTGMNRLGMELHEWAAIAELALAQRPTLVMSHLACADEPDHPMNPHQLEIFRQMTDGITVPRSLAATGGILLGPLAGGTKFKNSNCFRWLRRRNLSVAVRQGAPFSRQPTLSLDRASVHGPADDRHH